MNSTGFLPADKLLFTPGPLTTSATVKDAMLHDAGSWHFEFNDRVQWIRRQLLTIAEVSPADGWEAVLLQGSGTNGVEAVFATCVPPQGKVCVLVNGAYGERMVRMLEHLKIEHVALRAAEDAWPDIAALEQWLHQDPTITHVAAVHCETTTGILNPIPEIGRVVRRHACAFIVDAMSSFGALPLDLEESGVDFLISSANKCLEGVPGFCFVIARRDQLLANEKHARCLSLNLADQLRGFEKNGQFRYTPPTHALLAFERALKEFFDEGGIAGRNARYRANHTALVEGMMRLGFQPYLPAALQSCIITAFHCPADTRFAFPEFYRQLSDLGFIIYPGKLTRAETFRIANIGHLFRSDILALLNAIALVKKKHEFRHADFSRGADRRRRRSPFMNQTNDSESRFDVFRSEGDLNLSAQRRTWSAEHIGEHARELLAADAKYFLHQSLSTPCLNVLSKVEGAWIEDIEGRRYLDFHGNCLHQVGFGNQKVIDAIKRQLDELSFCPRRYTNESAIKLAARLTSLAPGKLKRVSFTTSGTTAIGMAMKYARVATGRFKFVSLWDSFHGASLDAISIGGEAAFRQGIGPLLPGCEHVPPPEPMRCPFRCGKTCNLTCADYLSYVLEKEGDVAAVIAETVRNTPFIPPPDYWKKIRAACDKHGTMLILDEIPIGLGRSGKLFAFENFGIEPDMVVLGKGLGGGILPLAALIVREDLDVAGHMALGHYTHEKNPVTCAAALAGLDFIVEKNLPERAAQLGRHALKLMQQMAAKHSVIADVRGMGLLLGIELATTLPDGSRQPAIAEAERVMYESLKRGLNFKVTMGNVLTLTPALTITQDELELALQILDEVIGEIEK